MSKAAESIRKGLEEAVAYAKGRSSRKTYRVHVPEHVDVKAIRKKLRMTHHAFAARFGFSVNTLRHWSRGSASAKDQRGHICSSSIARQLPSSERSASRRRAVALRFR
jgi:putative transcriptional regulator